MDSYDIAIDTEDLEKNTRGSETSSTCQVKLPIASRLFIIQTQRFVISFQTTVACEIFTDKIQFMTLSGDYEPARSIDRDPVYTMSTYCNVARYSTKTDLALATLSFLPWILDWLPSMN